MSASETDPKEPTRKPPRPNGMTDEQEKYLLAHLADIQHRKHDPDYLARQEQAWEATLAYREWVNKQEIALLDATDEDPPEISLIQWFEERATLERETAMPVPTKTPVKPVIVEPEKSAPRTNGLTEEQLQEMLAAAGRRKNDPGYLERGREGIVEYRRRIQEEYERELAEEESK